MKCDSCGRERKPDEPSYSPLTLFTGQGLTDPGWYSGDDGELCGDCMGRMFRKANGLPAVAS